MNIKQRKIKIETRIKLHYNIYNKHVDVDQLFIFPLKAAIDVMIKFLHGPQHPYNFHTLLCGM